MIKVWLLSTLRLKSSVLFTLNDLSPFERLRRGLCETYKGVINNEN